MDDFSCLGIPMVGGFGDIGCFGKGSMGFMS
jgi:hypothetical protein